MTADFFKRIPGNVPGVLHPFIKDGLDELRLLLITASPIAHATLFAPNGIDERLFAIQATNACALTTVCHPALRAVIGVELMKTPDRAVRWIAGIVPPHPRRIGFHGADLLLYLLRRLARLMVLP